MAQAKHTPGPWHIADFADEATTAIITAEGDGRIADVGGNTLDAQIIAADARLIAAAPALLAALEAIEARLDGVWDNPALMAFGPLSTNAGEDCKAIARAAIASARGA